MSSSINISCPHCAVTNRIPAERLNDGPNCGKCGQPVFAGQPMELSAGSFQKTLQNTEIPVVVDFWAEWCGPCKMMGPEFARAAAELEPGVRLAKLDTENHGQAAAPFNIRGIPTMIMFKNGQEVARQSGAMQAAQIVQWVRQHA